MVPPPRPGNRLVPAGRRVRPVQPAALPEADLWLLRRPVVPCDGLPGSALVGLLRVSGVGLLVLFVDTETCGFNGPCVLIQWAQNDGPVYLHEVFRRPRAQTLALIEAMCRDSVVGFNLPFDWFHLQRTYCVLRDLDTEIPNAESWRRAEGRALDGPCVKPKAALDLLLHARKGPLQQLMGRKPIRVRKVPAALREPLRAELDSRIHLDPILFAKRSEDVRGWQVQDEDVVLRFGASARLKDLGRYLLKRECLDYPVPQSAHPKDGRTGWNWVDSSLWRWKLDEHIAHWATNPKARQYAEDDVTLTRDLWTYFGEPEPGDDDSELAVAVACSRFRGLTLNLGLLDSIAREAEQVKESAPRAPGPVLHGLHERLGPLAAASVTSSENEVLERLTTTLPQDHPVVAFATKVQAARSAEKALDIATKLKTAGRAFFDFRVIGTLSGRMSGAGNLNPQGIPGRGRWACLRDAVHVDQGGDFDAFEVGIAASCYGDDALNAALDSGRKIHALFGAAVYGTTYEEMLADKVRYGRAKAALFASFYGAQVMKMAATLGLTTEQAQAGIDRYLSQFPGVAREQQRVSELFCTMRQPNGTHVEWQDPAESVESLLGYRRFFTLENKVCRALYDLAQNPPAAWDRVGGTVERRRGRRQKPGGAVRSALFGCAFSLQARNARAAGNHRIQSTGAEITKRLQRRIWDQQPAGVHPWRVQPLNVHDEVIVRGQDDCSSAVETTIAEFREVVPRLGMHWKRGIQTWGDLK